MTFGKKLFTTSTLGVALCVASAAGAQELDYVGVTRQSVHEAKAQPASVPPGVQLVELERWFFRDDTYSVRPLNSPSQKRPGSRQGVLGFISYTPFEGSVPLYLCLTNDYRNRFTSRDAGCEGHLADTAFPITGYVSPTQIAGTVPLYRCMRGGLKPGNWADHFDTTDANCENVKNPANDGIIGYIWL